MAKSLHQQAGLTPNLKAPTVAIASLDAGDFKRLAQLDKAMGDTVIGWLTAMTRHPATPASAWRNHGMVNIRSFEAINQAPWWRCLIVECNPATGRPLRDPDDPELYQSMLFTPPIPPPVSLIEAIDEMSGKRLTNRIDGGPTPTDPNAGGAGLVLPRKSRIKK